MFLYVIFKYVQHSSMAGEEKEPTGPIDNYEWDSQYFSTLEEVVTKLSKTHGKVTYTYIPTRFGGFTVVFFADGKGFNMITRQVHGVTRVYSVMDAYGNLMEYPIGLPSDTTLLTLPAGTTLYRMREEGEGKDTRNLRFYAERTTFQFSGAAKRYGRLYKYKLLQNVRLVNFNKRWRSRLWGGDQHNYKGSFATYEYILKQLCEKVGAQGWRACVWLDQHKDVQRKKFSEAPEKEFEIALFSSDLVDTGTLIKEFHSEWRFNNTPKLRF
jgi:hypothetical protein